MEDRENAAVEWLKSALLLCGLPPEVKAVPPETIMPKLQRFGGSWLVLEDSLLTAQQAEALAGENHKLLDALQYLMNATLNLGQEAADKTAYTVEFSGYREQRYLQLSQMAEEVTQQVRQTGAAVEMTPLPAAERRLIHTLLSEEADLETFSRGQDPERRLIVEPKA
jgi:spoIIIJ-associated protein